MYIIRYVDYSALVRRAAKLRSATSLSFPKKKYLFIYFLFNLFFYFAPEQARSCCSIPNKNGDHGPQLVFIVGIKT